LLRIGDAVASRNIHALRAVQPRTAESGDHASLVIREAIESRLFALSRSHDPWTPEKWEGAGLLDLTKRRAIGGPRVESTLEIGGRHAFPNIVAYGASKAAVIHMTRAAAQEYGRDVRINAIAPGPIETPMLEPVC
jgi:NAD(P)-dependent dehydrogenase (short-subunit alcohol dehydrogenase family)